MKPSIWLREAIADTRSGASRPYVWGLTFLLLLVVLCGWDVWSINRVSTEAAAYQDSGASTWITESIDGIDAKTCDGLDQLEGFSGAGALASATSVRLTIMPNTPITTYRVTPGFAELILGKRDVPPGTLLSKDLAESIGAVEGSTFESTTGSVTFDAIYPYPSDGRLANLQNAVLIVDSTSSTFDACWYKIWPFSEAASGSGILAANDPSTAKRSQLNSRNGIEFSVPRELDAMNPALLIPVAVLAAGIIGWIAVRSRRSELASALHSTVNRTDLAIIVALQTLFWSLPTAITALAASYVAISLLPPGPDPISPVVAGIAAASLAGVLAGAMIATLTIRSDRLFTYLRDRR